MEAQGRCGAGASRLTRHVRIYVYEESESMHLPVIHPDMAMDSMGGIMVVV